MWLCWLTGVLRISEVWISDLLLYLQVTNLGAGHTAVLLQLCVWLVTAFCPCQTQAIFGTHACLVLAETCPVQWVTVYMTA